MKKPTKYRIKLEVFLCHVWETAGIDVYRAIGPVDMLIGARALHAITRDIDDDYWLLVDAVDQAMARVYHSDESDPWSIWRGR